MHPRYADAIDGILQHHYALARAELKPEKQVGVSLMFQPMVYNPMGDRERTFDLSAELATRRERAARRLAPSSVARHG